MKNISILLLIFFSLGIQIGLAQVKSITPKKTNDTTKRITIPGQELKFTQGSTPVLKTDAPAGKGSNAAKNVYYPPGDPGHPGDPGDPTDPRDPRDPVDPIDPPTSSSSVDAGRMAGNLDVSATGGATYSIPITLPPGLGNVVPELSIVYNSQGGNGSLGLGWNLSGVSAISRIPATMFHDGFIGSTYWDSKDRFALDGQRLMLKSGTYGADGAEYQTENYSNVRIFSRGQSGIGPDYFEVLLPDGSKIYYGVGVASETSTSYAITYSESPLGARINYYYTNSNNSLAIARIEYGSMGSTAGINQIIFSYSTAIRGEQAYTGGGESYNSILLTKISVVANGNGFRNYNLTYGTVSDLNYQRITAIQEFNGDETKALEPVYFTYQSTGNVIPSSTISNFGISGIDANNSEIVTADFTGNGTMDFLWYDKANKNKFYAFYDMVPNGSSLQWGMPVITGAFKELIPATWLSHNDKLMPQQGLIVVKENGPGAYKFEMLSAGITSTVYYQYDRVWDTVPYSPTFYAACDGVTYQGTPLDIKFVSGDFNGDGLTDVIGINNSYTLLNKFYGADPVTGDNFCDYLFGDVGSSAYFINMDRRLTSGYVTNIGSLPFYYRTGEKLLAGDFNGDGKTDILHIAGSFLVVYSMNSAGTIEALWQTTGGPTSSTDIPLLGDYNGDGKMDIMFSTGYNSQFSTFISTGSSFIKYTQNQPFANTAAYWSPGGGSGSEVLRQYYLVSNDVDGDGKTDIIRGETVSQNGVNGGTINLNVYYNLGPSSSDHTPTFGSSYSMSQFTNLKHNPIPIFQNPNRTNFRPEFGFVSDATITLFKFQKDFRSEAQISTITQDAVSHTITYNELTGEQNTPDIPLYQTSLNQTYPYVDLYTLPGVSVVSQLTRNYNGEQIKQVFGYGNAVSHIGGLGFAGFGELIRSNWHVDNNDNSRFYNISIFNPQLRGAMVRSFSAKSTYINPYIKDLALTATATADGASLNDYISRTDQVYSTQLLSNKVFINSPLNTVSKDMLTGTFNIQSMEYDSYFNVTKSVSNINGTGSKTVEVTYDNNLSGYYIGRPLNNKITVSNGSDSFSTEEEYTFSGFLPTQIKKKGNGTGWITDNLGYDGFGNLIQQTTTEPGGAQRTVTMSYDPTGRFKISSTNIESMLLTSTYDNSTGNILSVTNPFGQTSSTVYDSWGRETFNTDYLGKGTLTYYAPFVLGGTSTTVTDEEGGYNITYYDAFGKNRAVTAKTVLGDNISTFTEYDVYGRLYRKSEPGASASQWNYTSYDDYGRVKQVISFTGKATNYSYSGLSMTINDGTKSVTTTKNAMGHILSLQDPGGTINYSYYANGVLKTADYGGITQTLVQDGWGRKTKLTDPSAGIYEYQYDGWGQLIKETTPKGTTDITYDGNGKISKKKLTGDDTLMESDYTYDPTTKLVTSISMTNSDGNNSIYSYTYDGNKQLSSTVEDNLHARFAKSYTYDSFGRISTENYEAKNKANNITASKVIELQYQNGELLQTSLQGTGQILWKVNALDGRGNLTQAMQGAALKNTSQYDTYGLPQQSLLENVSSTPVTLMNLGYSYDAQRGLLNSRSNSAFTWSESFSYDNQDRLTGFNDNLGNNSQDYDSRGRITDNSQLGTYTYDGNTYRQSELMLNSGANPYYQQDHALQQISFNAFKSPVEIIEQGKERISFQYNASLNRAHMYYGDEQVDKLLRRYRRHYSDDGGMEITNDIQTGKTSFIFYLGADAYNAPAIWKEVHENGQNTQNLYYLHRDHLGSIIMVTNDQGNVVEKRQFDAWGNIVRIQDGLGNDLAAFVILDRGYTGHEHLLGVGLIHMNGRLYDPKLHRFLSPDNFVQNQYNTQNYNRYAYAMNNPLMFTDANGEFFHLIIGALIGGIVNWIANGAEFSWKGLGYFGVGAAAGALGAGVGAGVGSALAGTGFGAGFVGASTVGTIGSGFFSGLTIGAAGGASGGFASGFGNALVGGDSFGSALNAGLKNGALGAIGGGVVGGLVGGVDAALDGRNFWSGAGETYHAFGAPAGQASDNLYSSTAEVRTDYQQNIASRDGMSLEQIETRLKTSVSLADNSNVGSAYRVETDGIIYGTNGNQVAGLTVPRYEGTFASRLTGTRIVIAPYVKGLGLPYRNMIIKHEMMHAWHSTFANTSLANRYSERAASAYSLAFEKSFALGSEWIDISRRLVGPYPLSFSWRRFARIVPLWITP
jgi:RHS repeat-associated protein